MISPAHSTAHPVTGREHGLTMIELLVTVVILSALIAGLSQLVVTNSVNANATGTLAGIADSGRTAIQLLATDIRRAGYLGGNIDILNTASTIGGTQGVASTDEPTCEDDNSNWARMVDQPLFGLNDTSAGYNCLVDEYLRGDVLTVRYAPATPIAVADMHDDKPYLRATMVEGRLFLGSEAGNVENEIADPSVRDYALAAYTYFVGPTGRTCQGREIPALFRKTIGDDGFPVSQELIAGVEHLQLRYLVGNRYYNADAVPLTASGRWPRVDAVEITVLIRAECPETGLGGNRTFDLAGVSYTPGAGEQDFRRQVFTTTTQLRN